MSSAILYVAIVAIWACVLIPRWLRRDSAHGAVSTVTFAVPGEAAGFADLTGGDGDAVNPSDTAGAARAAGAVGAVGTERAVQPPDARDARGPAPEPLGAGESRRRMLRARRRLLIMLLALEAAAVALAVLGLAAMWVVAPPSVMLASYLLLLREAAHADAERARREAEADARAHARERARARAARRAAAAAAVATSAETAAVAAALAARLAAAPVAADYEDSGQGRDFAPGLAGKYTPSYAEPDPATEDYDTYDHLRRAVGD
jgi:hypothetical protein